MQSLAEAQVRGRGARGSQPCPLQPAPLRPAPPLGLPSLQPPDPCPSACSLHIQEGGQRGGEASPAPTDPRAGVRAGGAGRGAGHSGTGAGHGAVGGADATVGFPELQLLTRIPWSPRGRCASSTRTATSWPTRWACRTPTSASTAPSRAPARRPAPGSPAAPNKLQKRNWARVCPVCGRGREAWEGRALSAPEPRSPFLMTLFAPALFEKAGWGLPGV